VDSAEKVASVHGGLGLSENLVPVYLYSAHGDLAAEPPATWETSLPTTSLARALVAPVL
jgi:hypothetical protein